VLVILYVPIFIERDRRAMRISSTPIGPTTRGKRCYRFKTAHPYGDGSVSKHYFFLKCQHSPPVLRAIALLGKTEIRITTEASYGSSISCSRKSQIRYGKKNHSEELIGQSLQKGRLEAIVPIHQNKSPILEPPDQEGNPWNWLRRDDTFW